MLGVRLVLRIHLIELRELSCPRRKLGSSLHGCDYRASRQYLTLTHYLYNHLIISQRLPVL